MHYPCAVMTPVRGKLAAPTCSLVVGHNASMTQRTLYLVAYDVCDPRRLQKVSRFLTGYRVGGQKSVYEIWATNGELRQIRTELERLMDADDDRLHILALDPRMKPRCLGRATTFNQSHFCIV
jgi:CRISPR-associated protein Cas2